MDTASDLPHNHPRTSLFFYLAKTDVIEYFYTAVHSACQEETNLSVKAGFTETMVKLMEKDLTLCPPSLWYHSNLHSWSGLVVLDRYPGLERAAIKESQKMHYR